MSGAEAEHVVGRALLAQQQPTRLELHVGCETVQTMHVFVGKNRAQAAPSRHATTAGQAGV
jgi:hypothetical protein